MEIRLSRGNIQNRTRKRQFFSTNVTQTRFFNKSFPRCEPSLAHRFTLFDCSLGKPTSRSKNKKMWLWIPSALWCRPAFTGMNRFCMRKLLWLLVPASFRRESWSLEYYRQFPGIITGFSVLVLSLLIKSLYKTINLAWFADIEPNWVFLSHKILHREWS